MCLTTQEPAALAGAAENQSTPVLSEKEKELVAVGISIAAGCRPCTDFHVKAVRQAGAGDDEIRAAVTTAVCVRRAATEAMAAYGLQHLGDAAETAPPCCPAETTRITELVAVGAAFAVSCTAGLAAHLAAARAVGVTDAEIRAVAALAAFIKERAASHVERLLAPKGRGQAQRVQAAACC